MYWPAAKWTSCPTANALAARPSAALAESPPTWTRTPDTSAPSAPPSRAPSPAGSGAPVDFAGSASVSVRLPGVAAASRLIGERGSAGRLAIPYRVMSTGLEQAEDHGDNRLKSTGCSPAVPRLAGTVTG
ncbi:MAG TPA: hypothetical protein VK601_26575 [Kofleriaceae bacterium]|nr:hypothetical protein [Kofleriaceae bacterium]